MELKSKIKSKQPIPWGKIIVIRELNVHPTVLGQMEKGIRDNNPKITEQELQQQVYKMVLRDNYFNHLMDLVAQSYEIVVDPEEENARKRDLKQLHPELDQAMVDQIVRINIMREIIFTDLGKEFGISVTDEQAKESLDRFYQQTGQPIREFLSNRKKFEDIKKTIFDQLISERLMNAFKPDFQLEEFNRRMEAERRQQQEQAAKKPN
ncbi:hypothetical protein J2Z62_000469 [Mycoplasmoides fastidiosum]|uniref:Trigger factor n=1 Tax=Mycoplasmoides fastidiosum TaxID=92758 RepID=A0ABU0LZ91_9BACT|nr:hypothetical protein [Mycoplasmoides fastidiosum]MDQ0514031.1 hypothetical protein [Mycoplasmoides fastidiosum]UUD37559.1 hypothetical protein NPA10_03260 [Mycoplasmoides fastidiosum]